MPTYEYECKSCGHRMELFQSMKDDHLKKCPACGDDSLHRLIGCGAGVIFKGSGFYCTDYRSENYKKAKKNDSPEGSNKAPSQKDKSSSKREQKGDKNVNKVS